MKLSKVSNLFLGALFFLAVQPAFATRPDPVLTPGSLCTASDPNFSGYRYKEQIPYCNRNVSHDEKLKIAQAYGNIPESEWPNYEFDHLIPLCAGGSDDISNIWPQPLTEAHIKDKLEDEIFNGLQAGTMTQQEAVQKIQDWVAQQAKIQQ